jgi:sporulation protein YlmC with PRC-barrel domain
MNQLIKPAGLFLVGISLFAFTLRIGNPITVDSIRNNFMSTLFDTYTQYDDTTVFFMGKHPYEDRIIKMYAAPKCGETPVWVAQSFYAGLDTSWTDYGPEVTARFKTLFGQDIIKTRMKMAAKDWEGNTMTWNHYNGLAVKAAFDKLYQKPTATYKGIALKKIYDLSFQQYVRDVTTIIIKVTANKAVFEAQAKLYLTKATTDPEFEGINFTMNATQTILGDYKTECVFEYYRERVVGTMLRRQIDGSLPILLTSLKTLLKDYDPTFYNQVATKF